MQLVLTLNPRPPAQAGRTNCPFLDTNLRSWNDASVWGGSVPQPGTIVTLPENTRVLVSGCMINQNATYTQIVVPASSEVRRAFC